MSLLRNRVRMLKMAEAEIEATSTAGEGSNDKIDTSLLPYILGTAGAGLAGLGAYKYLRSPTFSSNPALREMQEAAQRGYTRVMSDKPASSLSRWLDEIRNDANIRYYDDLANKKEVEKLPGLVRHWQDLPIQGEMNIGSGLEQASIDKIIPEDKALEYKFWNRHAPGSMGKSITISDVLKELGYKDSSKRISERRLAKLLPKLQEHLRERFPQGFVIKETQGLQSGGRFPTHADDLSALLKQYRERDLENVFKRRLQEAEAAKKNSISAYRQMQQEPGWSGRVVDVMRKSPDQALVQEMLPLERKTGLRGLVADFLGNPRSQEVRVHVERGQAIPELAMSRYDPLMHVFERKKLEDAATFAQSVVDRLPKKYKNTTFAMDIAPLEGGGFKLIESNPGPRSGVLMQNPFAPELLSRQLTGRWNVPVSAAGGGLAAIGGGTAGYLGGKAIDSYNNRESPSSTEMAAIPQELKQTPLP